MADNTHINSLADQIKSAETIQQLCHLTANQPPPQHSNPRATTKLQTSLIQQLIQLNSADPPGTILSWLGAQHTATTQPSTLLIHSIHHIITTLTQPSIHSILLITNLLQLCLSQSQLIHHYHSIFHQPNQLESSSSSIHQWTSFINHYLSLPTKLSNLIYQINQQNPTSTSIQILNQLQPTPFFTQISLQFYSLIRNLASSPNPLDSIQSTTYLLNKLINIGFISSGISNQQPEEPYDFFSSIWSELLSSLHDDDKTNESSCSTLWNANISSLPRTECKSFINSFLIHLQSYLTRLSIKHGQPEQLSSDPTSDAIERLGAKILNFILGPWGARNPFGSTDIYQLIIEILTDQTTKAWNIVLARSEARWTLINSPSNGDRKPTQLLVKYALTSFGSHHQISNGDAFQQSFLLVLILLSTSSIKFMDQQDKNDQEKFLQVKDEITLDPIFVNSIQRSLNSLRVQFRLLGMLMAELLTEIHNPSSQEQGTRSKKKEEVKLDFGHDFEAFEDDENRLCVKIRNLSRHWNPLNNPSDSLWIQILSDSLNDYSNHLTQSMTSNKKDEPPDDSHGLKLSLHKKKDEPIDNSSTSHKLIFDEENNDPNELSLSELRLSVQKPSTSSSSSSTKTSKIEVLNSTSYVEPYEIPQEELESLYPSTSNDNEPEIDYSILKDSDQATKPFAYLSQLSSCFKDYSNQSFSKLQLALSQAEPLIKKKTGWGNELNENAIDLTFSVLNLQDNFDIEGFEKYRQKILVSLIVGSPLKVVDCLIEQLFYHQYTISQRLTMLNSIILALLELTSHSNNQKLNDDDDFGFKRFQSDQIHERLLEFQSANKVSTTSTENRPRLIMENEDEDEEKYTKDYYIDQPKPQWISKKLEMKRNANIEQAPSKNELIKKKISFQPNPNKRSPSSVEIEEKFLMLLMNRMNWYLDQFELSQNTSSRANQNKPFSGAGWMILFEPLILMKILETLKLLILSLIDTFLSSSSTITNTPTQIKIFIKEIIHVLVRIIQFLLLNRLSPAVNNEHGVDDDKEAEAEAGGINDEMVINQCLRLIVHLVTYLNPTTNDHQSTSTSKETLMIMNSEEVSSSSMVLDSYSKLASFNHLFNYLFSLVCVVHSSSSLLQLDFFNIFKAISQILELA